MMTPETRRFLRQNLHLVRDADLRAEVQDLPEGDNFRRLTADTDAALARVNDQVATIRRALEGDAESRSASRALGWWVVALLVMASVAVGMVVGHFAVKMLSNAAATVVQAQTLGGW